MENNKISFGFNKISKKPNLLQLSKPLNENKIELIDCLEEQSIKIKNAVKDEEKGPLIIPIRNATKNLADRIREMQEKQNSSVQEVKEEIDEKKPETDLTIDELAARELIKDAQNREQNSETKTRKLLTLPSLQDTETLLIEGVDEPTTKDYENVPIEDYGMAILRGMGWSEGMTLGRNPTKIIKNDLPELRPKGLGLGANKIVTNIIKIEQQTNQNGNELILIKGAYAKVIAGKSKGNYCQVLGFDDESSRVIVQLAIGDETLTLNEFLIVPVTKDEYIHNSKVLNNAKYEEYKDISEKRLDELRKSENNKTEESLNSKKVSSSDLNEQKHYEHNKYKNSSDSESVCRSRSDNKSKHESESRSRDRKSKKKSKKHQNRSRDSSNSDQERRRRSKKTHKSKSRHRRRTRSRSGSENESKYKK